MKSNLRQAIIVIGCLFLCASTFYACNTKNDLQVISKNFESEIEQLQNLQFSFNKDLCPDSLLNRWDSTEYISFTPAVKGVFKWNSSSELIFSPSEGFAPGTEYTATLTKLLMKHSKKSYSFGSEPFKFHTAPLSVTASNLSWTRGKNASNVMVQLDMSFNYEVNLAEAASKLKLSSNGTSVSASSVNTGNGKVLSLQFSPINDKDQETPLKIELNKGIPIAGSKVVSEKDTSFVASIPSRYSLSIVGVTAQHTGSEGVITVSTSQPVLDENLKSMISIIPASPFEVVLGDGGFTITGKQLSPSQTYELSISSKLEGTFGGKMKSDYSEQLTFGKLDPSIKFSNHKGMYISSAGMKNIELSIVNVHKVTVRVVKVYENNLLQFVPNNSYNGGYNGDDEGDEGDGGGDYDRYSGNSSINTENLGDEIFKQTYETSKLPGQNAARVLHLDFEDKIKNYKGIYVLSVESDDQSYLSQARILCVSDIGLIAKAEDDKIYVFANSIRNATAMPGVKVGFISTNNQELYTATTDEEGVAIFKDISKQAPGFNVGMITAKLNDDFSMMMLKSTKIGTSRFDVGGRRPSNTVAFLYPERNLYRPGETIHVSAIVRDDGWNPQHDVPVKIELTKPDGKEFETQRKILNEQGSCEVSFSPPSSAMTGTYTANLYSGNGVLLSSYNISVEEFVPDRMKVALKLDKDEYDTSETVTATIQADNLFGTPAAGRNYECEMTLRKEAFESDKFPDYDFDLNGDVKVEPDLRNESKTDEKGAATEEFDLGDGLAGAGTLKGNIAATVFDETGRPVHRYASFTVYTQPVFAGIKCRDNYVSSKSPVHLGLVAVDKNGNPRSTEVQVELVKKEWNSVIQQNGDTYRYVSVKQERVISQQRLTLKGNNTDFIITPQQSGDYEVRVFVNGSNFYVSKDIWAYGWGETQYTSFEVNNEGNVEIKADKKEYNVGDNVNVLFTTPFEGKMLVTLEQNHVLKYYFLNTKDKSASLSFKADEEHIPNVYVTATLFRPMDGNTMPLTVAHGFQSVTVTKKEYELPVTITAVEKSRSKMTQTISVKTTPGAYVTIAAVDEGILQVKDFHTPDPYNYFYQKMALGIESYDIYPWLMPEIKSTLSSTGGDEADKTNNRVNPMFVNRFKNVSFWSGILQADGGGNVKYNIDIPQFSGDLRIMAVVYKDKGFGSADKHMKVADPIVVSVALPRFLSPKDEVVMPVSVTNTTAKNASATVTVKVTGPLGIKGESSQTVEVPANREQRVVFNIDALPSVGAGKVTVTVRSMGENFVNETDMSVRPPASLQKLTGSGLAAENTATPVDLKNNFIPSSVSGKMVVSKSPMAEFSKHLDDLVRYPYGCVEQTTSAAFPQLYFGELIKSMNVTVDKELNPAYNVQQAITKLQSMQMGDGALSYWPTGGYASWWGSVYASHFLFEAKKAGYQVNPTTLARLQDYMKYKLNTREIITFFYNTNQKKDVAPEEVPYSLYVLALQGQSQPATMNYYKAHQELLTLDGKYLLAAAYSLSGMPSQAKEVLPSAFTGEIANHCFNGSFYSYIRDEALSLNVLLDIDPTNPQVGIMAKQLSDQIRHERYLSTQENVFSMLAFGKIAKMANKTTSTASITANGKTINNTTGPAVTVNMKNYANDNVAVKVNGKGPYYYFWEVDGITSDGSYKEEDSYLKVRRTFFDRSGNINSSNSFRQNDLIVVRLSIEAQYDGQIDNVAITDMLPAGFEIENTRLTEMPNMDWIKEKSEADYMDIRDDRINMFTSVGRTRRDYYYMVRAVSPGTYQLGPVQADAMYDGNYHSYNGAGVVKIADK